MINFCGTPVIPRAIPNVLGDMFGSSSGEGKRLLDNLGSKWLIVILVVVLIVSQF